MPKISKSVKGWEFILKKLNYYVIKRMEYIMTKDEVSYVIKRYSFLYKPIKNGNAAAVFYVGNRKQTIEITSEVKTICEIIEIVYETEKDLTVKQMIKGLISGRSDIWIMHGLPFSKNAYYSRKGMFFEKIYNCCKARGLVSFEEILVEEIA